VSYIGKYTAAGAAAVSMSSAHLEVPAAEAYIALIAIAASMTEVAYRANVAALSVPFAPCGPLWGPPCGPLCGPPRGPPLGPWV
jgi:hypothetical protein